ncbi:hypothetical protein PPUJ13061_41140 [Pseudomonas putida]|nr:hypothetical protein PPUJ13061_41140 [Pseudomonas putida]
MSLSNATGTNSVVLKMKAARARAMTLSQLPLPAVGGMWVGMGPFMGGKRFSADKATVRTPATACRGADVRAVIDRNARHGTRQPGASQPQGRQKEYHARFV